MGRVTGAVREDGTRPPFLRRVVVAAVAGSVVGAAVFAAVATTSHGPSATSPGSGAPSGAAHATTASVTTRLAALPLAFAQGTTTTPSYVAGAPGYDVQVTPDQVDLAVVRGTGQGGSGTPAQRTGTAPSAPTGTATSQVGLDLVGADPAARLSTQGALPGHVNMFVGPRHSWRSDLPTYSTVVAHDAWPGVDVSYGGSSGNLEYTLTVAAGADPSIARLRLTGVTGLHVDSRGDLVGRSAVGPVTEQALRAWQVVGGHRHAVPASYRLQGTTVSFQVGSYDRSRPLVIDPTVVTGYATYLSGFPLSEVLGLATDQAGDTYAVGFTGGTGFPTTGSPAYGGGLTDAFVTELDPTGTHALFSTYLGGIGEDVATAVALGPSGSIYVAGYTDSPDFPIVGGTPNTNDNNTRFGAENDGFLTVLAAGGSSIDASTLIGGSGEDEIEALAVDAAGNAHIAGLTTWNDFPGMGGTAGTSADISVANSYAGSGFVTASSYAFVATVDDSASGLVLGPVTNFGNELHIEVDALTLDSSGDAFVAGGSSNALATVGGAYSGSTNNAYNKDGGFVAEVAPTGTVTWLAWMGPAMQLYGITLDAAGNVDVVGAAYPGLATTTGVVDPTDTFGPQAMAASLSPNGATLRWATYLGGTNGTSEADAVVMAPDGSLLVAGGTASTSGVATAGAPQATYGGGSSDAFLVDLAPDATSVAWGTYLGGPGADWAMSMSPVPGGVAIGGLASPPSFPVTAGSLQTTPVGGQYGFVADVLVAPTVTSVSPASGPATGGTTVTVTGTGFTGATAVHVGTATAAFTVVSDTQLTVTTPAGTAGTVDVTVTGPGGTSTTSTADQFIYQANQATLTITITTTSATYGQSLTLATSGGTTGGAVTYQVTSTGSAGCSVTGATLTFTSAGTCTVTATMAGDTNYLPVSSAPTVITVHQAAQAALTITTTTATYGQSLTLATSGGTTGGAVTYQVTSAGSAGCSVTGATLTFTSAGSCSVQATMAGNTNYLSVSSVPTTITVGQATQAALTITTTTATYGQALTLATTGGTTGGTVTYQVTSTGSASCSVTGSSLTFTSAGSCSVQATMAGNTDYLSVSSAPTTITVGQASQAALTITTTSATYGQSLTLATTGGTTGGTVTYQVTSAGSAGCSVTGSTLTFTGAGTCTLTATMTGDTDYLPVSSSPTTITAGRSGYLLVAADGGAFAFGSDRFAGSCPAPGSVCSGVSDIVGTAATPGGTGYWLVGADGAVYPFGTAASYGSMAGHRLDMPVVGMVATPDGRGYWLVAADGGVFAFGDATFAGSEGGAHLDAPVVGMVATPDGKGYWLVAADGGVFAFGTARYAGSCPAPGSVCAGVSDIVGAAAAPGGRGYWLVGADGAVYPFGTAASYGSMAGHHLDMPVVGIAATPDGKGYWLVAADGGVFAFGDATFAGSEGGTHLDAPVVGVATTPAARPPV